MDTNLFASLASITSLHNTKVFNNTILSMALALVAWMTNNVVSLHLPKILLTNQLTLVTDKQHKHILHIHTFVHTCIQHMHTYILHNTVCVFLCGECVEPLQSLGVLQRGLLGLMDERHSLLAFVVSLRLLFFLSCFTGLCAVAGHLVVQRYYSAIISCMLSNSLRKTEVSINVN